MVDAPSNKTLLDTYVEVASKNFAILSALATVMIAFIATLFLYSYLSVFDSSLIWLIEYPDILKLCLVGVALMSSSFMFIYNVVDNTRYWFQVGNKHVWFYVGAVFAVFAIMFVVNLYNDYKSEHPTKEYHIYSFTSYAIILFTVCLIIFIKRDDWQRHAILSYAIFAVLISSYFFGRTYGLYVRDVSKEYRMFVIDAREDQLQALAKAKIVFITSHHTIVFGEEKTVTLQSADIKQIISLAESKLGD